MSIYIINNKVYNQIYNVVSEISNSFISYQLIVCDLSEYLKNGCTHFSNIRLEYQ